MRHLLGLLRWILKASVFFLLFAFALNNPQDVTVHFYFGHAWTAPMILVILVVFTLGVATGVLGMLAGRSRRKADRPELPKASPEVPPAPPPASPVDPAAHGV